MLRPLLALLFLAAGAALADAQPVTEQQARALVPRADLSGLNDAQRAVFLEVAGEVFNYAGCQDTLQKCLASGARDEHAPRMAKLVAQLAALGATPQVIENAVEKYYASFDARGRLHPKSDNCPTLGKGPVTLVEFSDYQCPHCAAAVQPLEELVEKDRKGEVRLCSKFFPFPSHPRARIAALCAEYARLRGKFWQMNALLFAHQDSLDDENLRDYANQLGLSGEEMLKQVYGGELDAVVEKHIREGTALGVESTPTLLFDGRANVLPVKPWFLSFQVDDEVAWRREKGWKFAPQQRRVAKSR